MHTLLVSFAKSADEEIQLKSVTGLGKTIFCLLQYLLHVLGIVFFLVQYMYNYNIRCQFSIANTGILSTASYIFLQGSSIFGTLK